jgi:hypothetical protein
MKTRTIIEHSTFKQMQSVEPLHDTKSIKNDLLNSIIEYYQDKYYRLKQATRAAIDSLCFLAADKGYCYASQTYLAESGISERTIRRIMKDLSNAGIIYITYRRKGHFNMCGKPVYLFVHHHYFKQWKLLLNINVPKDSQTYDRVETIKNGSTSSENDSFSVSTFSISKNKQDHVLNNRETLDLVPDNIDHDFAHLYSCYFGVNIKQINELWHICKRQSWKINIEPEHMASGAIHALKQTVGQMKIKKIRNFAAYFTNTLKSIYHDIFTEECDELITNG